MVKRDLFRNQHRREHAQPGKGRDGRNAGRQGAFGFVMTPRVGRRRVEVGGEHVAARFAQVAGHRHQQVQEVRVEGGEQRHLNAQVPQQRGASGGRQLFGGGDNIGHLQAAAAGHVRHVNRSQPGLDLLVAERLVSNEIRVAQVAANDDRGQGQEQIGVRPGLEAQVAVGLAGGLGDPGIDDDHRAGAVAGQGFQPVGRIVTPVADMRVGAEHQQKIGRVMVGVQRGARRAVQHPFQDHPVLRLFLSQSVKKAPRAQQRQKRHPERRVQMVGLAANPDQADGARRVPVADTVQLGTDFGDGLLPADLLKAALGPTLERMRDALGVVHIGGNAEALIADIAVRDRARLVRPNMLNVSVDHIDPQATVMAAQHTHRGLICGVQPNRRSGD